MPLGSNDTAMAIERAERAMLAIKRAEQDFADGKADGLSDFPREELTPAIDAFAELEALTALHADTSAIVRAAVCGSVKLAAMGRGLGKLDLVRRVNGLLARLASHPAPDPVTRRAFAEASIDLMLAEAGADQVDQAIETYSGIAALAGSFSADADLAGAQAKAAANLIALALESGREAVAERAMRELAALNTSFPNEEPVRLQMARGRFNQLAWSARAGSPAAAMAELKTLLETAIVSPDMPEVIDLASDAAFVLVTRLGTRQHHQDALQAFRILSQLTTFPGAGEQVTGRLAEAAFNLITDLCEDGRRDEAQLIYDDLSGLSVAEDGNRTIRLAHAKAAANLAMTHEAIGDMAAVNLLLDDLKVLVHAHPDDIAVFEIAALVDRTD